MSEGKPEAGEMTHDEAEQIALAYIDKAFNNPEKLGRRIRHSIPANPREDTDLRLMAYIEQQRGSQAALVVALREKREAEAEVGRQRQCRLANEAELIEADKRIGELRGQLASERAGRERAERMLHRICHHAAIVAPYACPECRYSPPPPQPPSLGTAEGLDDTQAQLAIVLAKLRGLKTGSDAWCRRVEAALGLLADELTKGERK
jgi:hypothetical protein